jgi:hypothetical protein
MGVEPVAQLDDHGRIPQRGDTQDRRHAIDRTGAGPAIVE